MRKRKQGLFLVEFAIIVVVLVMMLFGVIELSRIIWVWNTADERIQSRQMRQANADPAW